MTGGCGGPEAENPPEALPVIHVWGKGNEVFPHPYLSDRPCILKFRGKIRIAPGEKACFTAVLPPLLKFELEKEMVLAEAMPLVPQQTFFGTDTMHGEFGYSLSDVLLAKQEEETAAPSILIHCDIHIKNNTKTIIERDHFTVWPESLNLYTCHDRLIADTVEYEISGTEYKLRIVRVKNSGCRLLSAGVKNGAGEIFVRQSVDIIRNITKGIV